MYSMRVFLFNRISLLLFFFFSKEQLQLRTVHRSGYAVRVSWNVSNVHYYMRSTEIV